MGKNIILEKLESGGFIGVDLDELKDMMRRAASERKIDLSTNENKREVLKGMGYEKNFDILRKEPEFSWL